MSDEAGAHGDPDWRERELARIEAVGGGGRNNVIPLLDGAENVAPVDRSVRGTPTQGTSPPAESLDCRCDGNPSGGACSYPDCQLPPPTTRELLGECPCDGERGCVCQ